MPLTGYKTNILLAAPDETVGQVLARLPDKPNTRRYTYVVAPLSDGSYLAVWWFDIEEAQRTSAFDLRNAPLERVAQEFGLVCTGTVSRSDNASATMERLRSQPGQRLVVIDQGQVVGVLDLGLRSVDAQQLRLPDAFFDVPPKPPLPGTRVVEVNINGGDEPETGTGSISANLGPDGNVPPPAADPRVFNAWIDGKPPEEPLKLGRTYDLAFNVDEPRTGAATATVTPVAKIMAEAGLQQLDIDVVIVTADFTVHGNDQGRLVVPRVGPSKNTVRFAIEPTKNGPGVISAVFLAQGRAIQKMTITLQVGEEPRRVIEAETSGLNLSSSIAVALRRPDKRQIVLTILRRDSHYQFLLSNGGVTRYTLNLSETYVDELIGKARAALLEIVRTPSPEGGLPVYQRPDTTIPEDIHRATLIKLAELGFLLYERLFYSPGSNDGRQLGDLLRKYSQEGQLWIEIVPEHFVFPWPLLYDRKPLDPKAVDLDGFWGFKHVIQYTPEFSAGRVVSLDPAIRVKDKLELAFVVNTSIDGELASKGLATPVVQPQREHLPTLKQVNVTEYLSRAELFSLMSNSDNPAQLIYLYCHAVSRQPGEQGGVSASRLVLTNKEVVTLDDLTIYAPPSDEPLKNAPLVFLNACESAELSPYLYDGLVPYLINKGARGVLGTEVETP
ncbi:MAG TPA: CHAT domain-containing protein, partial [Roseiflexaceae bacterium]|nr:CHAT domain-containing protein [Roseiflexaceae bacterium]